ncbi:IclR family transcriptional regulator [Nesterenkonia flava]|uniref:IclR family transcriptional regulator n=1 Tax=Nesterenkonia flava TaxID=469799 RepID=A0ABU1FQS8_9MICC|nr:IclR family transcriptional regulator [Nesterenkonia flava]MDR5710546.1 IclR family transcriptional regulator [Nesterenkonia flava]
MDAAPHHDHPKPTAASRLLSLLGAFSSGDGALRLTDIRERAGLSLTTTHRLVQELLAWGGLETEASGRYRLSAKFLELASRSTRGLHVREAALPFLVDLQRRTGLTVHLGVRNGRNVLNLEALRLHPNYGGANRIGGSIGLHMGATGLVLLAYAPPGFVDLYVQEPLQQFTEHTIASEGQLRAALQRIREDGYAIASHTPVTDRAMVAAPVMNSDGEIEASLGLICWLEHHEPASYIGPVRAAARRISEALQGRLNYSGDRAREFRLRYAALVEDEPGARTHVA